MKKLHLYLLWISKIIISVLFILASIGKLTNDPSVIQMFQEWGYFKGFHMIIGVLEFVLAILLLIPKTSVYAGISLFVLMIGAMVTHLLNDPITEIFRPAIFMFLLTIIVYLQWDKIKFRFSKADG